VVGVRNVTNLNLSVFVANKCYQCGYCCTKRPCRYGSWDEAEERCIRLTKDNKCSIYDEIVEIEKGNPFAMMGSGCSSPLFNKMRDEKILEVFDGVQSVST